jgi:hypothetical protein
MDLLVSTISPEDTVPLGGETIDCFRRENQAETNEHIAQEAAACWRTEEVADE